MALSKRKAEKEVAAKVTEPVDDIDEDQPTVQKRVRPVRGGLKPTANGGETAAVKLQKADKPEKIEKTQKTETKKGTRKAAENKKEAAVIAEPKSRARNKKEPEPVEDAKVEVTEVAKPAEPIDDEEKPEPKKRGRKGKAAEAEVAEPVAVEPEEVVPKKRNRKANADQESVEKPAAPAKNGKAAAAAPAKEVIADPLEEPAPAAEISSSAREDFTVAGKNARGLAHNFKISSWNVAGIRAWVKKNGVDYFSKENADIYCLQETKCSEKDIPKEVGHLKGYHRYMVDSKKPGYCGVMILSREKPIHVKNGIGNSEQDKEGRMITAEYKDFYVICVYVPNAGAGLKTMPKRMEWNDLFLAYVNKLNENKPVIVCGDMNVAHNEIDLKNPQSNKKHAGFTQEERDGMSEFLERGYIDTFRKLYPDQVGAYTFWTYMANARAKNTGWRLDYFIVSERFMENVCDNRIRSSVMGSDHCPITLFLNCDD